MKRVLYSGFFDLFHVGHLGALKKAKEFGYLIVHVASDKEARAVKGIVRPVIPLKERAEIIRELRCVDEVFAPEDYMTTEEIIKVVNADIVIRNEGSAEKFSVETLSLPRYISESKLDTTGIINKIKIMEDQKELAGVNYIIFDKDRRVLLQRRDNKEGIRCRGALVFPGGALNKGENPHECVAREVKEETGLNLHLSRFMFLTDFTYPWGETNRFYLIYLDEEVKIQETEGTMEWHPFDSLESLELCGNQNEIIKLLQESYRHDGIKEFYT